MAYLCKWSRCNRVIISLYFLDLVNFTMPKYAVAKGRQIGVYDTWDECKTQTQGFNGARYKKFDTQKEAEDFIKEINGGSTLPKPKVKNSTMTTENLNSNKTDIFPVSKISPSNTLLHDFNNRLNIMESKLSNFMDSVNSALDNLKKRISSLEDKRTIEEQTSELESENDRIINGTESKGKKRKAESEESMNFDDYEKDDDVSINEITINSTDRTLPKQKKTKLDKCKILDEIDGYYGIAQCVVNSRGFLVNPFGAVVVYTDGACTNNGKVSAKAGIGVWFNHSHPLNVCAPVRGRATNNNAEIQAATAAIRQASKEGIRLLHIYTDSKFLINCITSWIFKWKRNNWKTSEGKPVINKIELVELDDCINENMESVIWTYVKGHSGEIGNTAADELAREGARLYVINK